MPATLLSLRVLGSVLAALILLLATPLARALTLSVSLNPDRVRPNEALIASITVSNNGGSAVSAVVLQARVPASGVNNYFATLLTGGGTCRGATNGTCVANELVSWNLGTLPAGEGVTVQMPMVVTNGTAAGSLITVDSMVSVNGTPTLNTTRSVTVATANALTLALSADKDAVVPSDQLTYTLTYGNRSATSTTGTTLSLPLPAGVTFVSASGGGTLMGSAVQWTLNTLQAGQSGRQQVVVTVMNGLTFGTVLPIDAAALAGTSAVTGAELAQASVVTRVQATQALGVHIAVNSDPVRSNEGLRTALTVTNRSNAPALGALLQVRVPTSGVNNFFATLLTGGGTCRGATNGTCVVYELVTWNLGTLAPGASTTVTMPAVVTNGSASGTLIVLDAFLTADSLPMLTARHAVAVDNDNALSLAVDADKDALAPGAQLQYTLTYGNRSTASVTGTTLSLPLPPGVTLVSASGGGTLAGNAVQWTLNTLQAGQSGRQQLVVTVDGGLAPGTVLPVDAATLSGISTVTGVELARATLASRVQSDPPLGLAIAMNADPVRSNEGLRTALTATNRSGATVFGAVLQVRVPTDGVNNFFATLLTGGGTCRGATNGTCVVYELVTWNLGTLAPGASATVVMPAVVTNGTDSGTLIVLEAILTADGAAMATARHTVAVDNDNALMLAVDVDKDAVAPGDQLTYTLTFGNRSTGTVTGTTLTFPLPAGATLVGSSGGTHSGNTVVWSIGSLQAGTGGRRTVTVSISASPPDAMSLSVDAAVLAGTSAATGAEVARGGIVTRIVAGNPLKLSVHLAPNPIAPTQTVVATLQVTNTGPDTLFGVALQARVPTDGVNNFFATLLTGGGACRGATNGVCVVYELVSWDLGTLAHGASVSVTMPMLVTNGTAAGRLIALAANVSDDALDHAYGSDTALVGAAGQYADTDGDSILDVFDNCTLVPNPDQRDTNNNGFGNVCDADFNGDGFVNALDLAIFKQRFGTADPDADLNGDGIVNALDLAIFKKLFGRARGPSGIAP